MSRLEEILKDEEDGFLEWSGDRVIAYRQDDSFFNAIKQYAKECVKASLEKASEKTDFLMIDIDEINVDDYEKIKESITNPENIVLL